MALSCKSQCKCDAEEQEENHERGTVELDDFGNGRPSRIDRSCMGPMDEDCSGVNFGDDACVDRRGKEFYEAQARKNAKWYHAHQQKEPNWVPRWPLIREGQRIRPWKPSSTNFISSGDLNPQELLVTVDASFGAPLGVGLIAHSRSLEVDDVSNVGLVPEWNALNPSGHQVGAGDSILEVNGISEDSILMLKEFRSRKHLKFRLQKGEVFEGQVFRV